MNEPLNLSKMTNQSRNASQQNNLNTSISDHYLNTRSNSRSRITKFDSIEFNHQYQLAGFWLRFAATFIDGVIIWLVSSLVSFLIVMLAGIYGADKKMISDIMVGYYLIGSPLLATLIFGLCEQSNLQATPGKLCFSLIVVDRLGEKKTFGSAFVRIFLKYLCFSLGLTILLFLIVAMTRKKQGVHDLATRSFVVKKNELENIKAYNKELRELNGLTTQYVSVNNQTSPHIIL